MHDVASAPRRDKHQAAFNTFTCEGYYDAIKVMSKAVEIAAQARSRSRDTEDREKFIQALSAFHAERLIAYTKVPKTWNLIDCIAFKTVPVAREMAAIRSQGKPLATTSGINIDCTAVEYLHELLDQFKQVEKGVSGRGSLSSPTVSG
ncbi:hypothetical protein BS17DRAFT_775018 [Gyrodon lividus]|nr:hypothetical protein BS17DRAFT_775018 [Gyrodon lividus]